MITFITAMAAAAAAQTAQPAPANPHAHHMQMGQMGQMDHPKMDHSQMAQHDDGCCKNGADGKMECNMSAKDKPSSAHQGHSAQ